MTPPTTDAPNPAIEVTTPVAAPPETVYRHLTRVEGLGFIDSVIGEAGGRALLLVAPDANGQTMLTLIADVQASADTAAHLEERARREFQRIDRLVQEPLVNPDAEGLEAIVEDQLYGDREAPLDQEGLDR